MTTMMLHDQATKPSFCTDSTTIVPLALSSAICLLDEYCRPPREPVQRKNRSMSTLIGGMRSSRRCQPPIYASRSAADDSRKAPELLCCVVVGMDDCHLRADIGSHCPPDREFRRPFSRHGQLPYLSGRLRHFPGLLPSSPRRSHLSSPKAPSPPAARRVRQRGAKYDRVVPAAHQARAPARAPRLFYTHLVDLVSLWDITDFCGVPQTCMDSQTYVCLET
nr:hypothetical protein CFP56_24542 [Quercus suber]